MTKKNKKEIKNWVVGGLVALFTILFLVVPAGKYYKLKYDEHKAEQDKTVIETPVEDENSDGVGSLEDETKTEIDFVTAFEGYVVG